MFGSHEHEQAAQVIFDLYDTDASGGLDATELEDYLLAVLMMGEAMKEGDAHTPDAQLAERAKSAAVEMVAIMDTDKNGVVSPEEFKAWFARNAQVAAEREADEAASSASAVLPSEEATRATQTCWADLRAMNKLFQMEIDQFDDFNDLMSAAANDDGSLTLESFLAIASKALVPEAAGGPSQTILKRIFARFDRDVAGVVALEEITVGFSAMFGASGDDSDGAAVDVIFDLYDTDHSGGLDVAELEDYLLSVLTMSETLKDDGAVHSPEDVLAEQAATLARGVRVQSRATARIVPHPHATLSTHALRLSPLPPPTLALHARSHSPCRCSWRSILTVMES
jgi:Ca2+-binding EF-hand superfamily protein